MRGFNQVEAMLDYYRAKSGKIPITSNIVKKIVDTPHLAQLGKHERQNSQPVYKVIKRVNNLNILIIDDVITTGSTANNLALILKNAGAKRVEVCTLMRTI